MDQFGHDVPLPERMQGRWKGIDNPAEKLVIKGGDVTCFGQAVVYDYKMVGNEDGALTVSLKINDAASEDAFQRANITELVITPDGDLHAYNVKFASQFIPDEG